MTSATAHDRPWECLSQNPEPEMKAPLGDRRGCVRSGPRGTWGVALAEALAHPVFLQPELSGFWWWHASLMLAMSRWGGGGDWGGGRGTRTGRGGKEGSVEIGQNQDFSFPPGLLRASDGLEQTSSHPGALSRVKGIRSITPRVSGNPAQAMRSGPEGGIRAEAVRCGEREFGSAGPFRCWLLPPPCPPSKAPAVYFLSSMLVTWYLLFTGIE